MASRHSHTALPRWAGCMQKGKESMTAQALGPSGHRTSVTLDPFLSPVGMRPGPHCSGCDKPSPGRSRFAVLAEWRRAECLRSHTLPGCMRCHSSVLQAWRTTPGKSLGAILAEWRKKDRLCLPGQREERRPRQVVCRKAKKVWPSRHGTRYFSPFMDKRAITTISRHRPRETRVISPP